MASAFSFGRERGYPYGQSPMIGICGAAERGSKPDNRGSGLTSITRLYGLKPYFM